MDDETLANTKYFIEQLAWCLECEADEIIDKLSGELISEEDAGELKEWVI